MDGYGVYQALAILLVMIPTHSGHHTWFEADVPFKITGTEALGVS
jgi:hypothetical protein